MFRRGVARTPNDPRERLLIEQGLVGMSTLMICPVCKGIRAAAAGSALGRRCTCSSASAGGGGAGTVMFSNADSSSNGMVTATSTGDVAVATKVKLCSVCGIDVTDKKRMKDGTTGRYWCYDCYLIEQRKKQPSGVMMRCPHCKKDYPPLNMIKHGDTWWCQPCEEELQNKGKKKVSVAGQAASAADTRRHTGLAANDTGKSSKPLIFAVAAVLAVAAIAYYTLFVA